jgi:hypothetical protein
MLVADAEAGVETTTVDTETVSEDRVYSPVVVLSSSEVAVELGDIPLLVDWTANVIDLRVGEPVAVVARRRKLPRGMKGLLIVR